MRTIFGDHNTLAGMAAGTVNGALMSPLALLKYQLWGHPDQNRSLWRQACSNYNSHGGLRTFFRGAPATCIRDMVFGATFSTLRQRDPESAIGGSIFVTNTIAAAVATVISGPFNFFRNIQFGVTPRCRTSQRTPLSRNSQFAWLVAAATRGNGGCCKLTG